MGLGKPLGVIFHFYFSREPRRLDLAQSLAEKQSKQHDITKSKGMHDSSALNGGK